VASGVGVQHTDLDLGVERFTDEVRRESTP
jgi:hypothetical protein